MKYRVDEFMGYFMNEKYLGSEYFDTLEEAQHFVIERRRVVNDKDFGANIVRCDGKDI